AGNRSPEPPRPTIRRTGADLQHRRGLATVAILVFVLAGCGGGSSVSSQEKVTAARWASGLRHWGSGMTRAINGISVLFSQPAAVRGIQAGDRRVEQTLARYERTLAGCSAQVRRLGAPPAELVL